MLDPRLTHYLLRYKWRYLLGFLALLSASLVVMLPPVALRHAIDSIAEGTTRGQLLRYALVILALAVVESALRFAARHLVSGTSRRVEYELRNDLAAKLMELDQGFYLRSHTGDLMARCTNDLGVVRELVGPALIDILRTFTMIVIGFGFLLSIDVRLALIAIAYFPVVAAVIVYFRSTVEAKFEAVQDQFGELANHVQETISGIRTIKAYAQEEAEIAAFARANREMMKRSLSWAYYTGAMWPLMAAMAGASTALVLWFGGHDVVSGRITIGQFVQFNSYLGILANPLMSLGWTVNAWQQGTASMRRIADVLNTRPAVREPRVPTPIHRVRGDISFRHVTFGYQPGRPVLRDIDLTIPAGTTVAVVGATGAGKTTLVNLLARLYDPWEGQITLDGVDIRELSLHDLRAVIGLVPQESFLFSESLRDNIALGRPDPPEEALMEALDTSQLVNDLPQLSDGLDTIIGERGVTLSGGQKQRAALARALLKDPPILILDDALAHVDTHTEEEILRRLRAFMERRTTILIAHRTSTVASADLIVVLDDGRIAEAGTHDELLRLDGLYARFYRRQLMVEQMEEQEPEPEMLEGERSA